MTATLGSKQRIFLTFLAAPDLPGQPWTVTNPTTVRAQVTDPNGAIVAVNINATSLPGVYYVDVIPTIPGPWHVWAEGDGDVEAAIEVTFIAGRPASVGVPLS